MVQDVHVAPFTSVLQPDQHLVKEILDELELDPAFDSEGDLAITTPPLTIYFLFGSAGDMFTVRTFYTRRYSVDDKRILLAALNEWNADNMWPKVYTFTRDNGITRVVGDCDLYIGAGVTREHLTTVITHWVRFAIKFHRWLTDRLAYQLD